MGHRPVPTRPDARNKGLEPLFLRDYRPCEDAAGEPSYRTCLGGRKKPAFGRVCDGAGIGIAGLTKDDRAAASPTREAPTEKGLGGLAPGGQEGSVRTGAAKRRKSDASSTIEPQIGQALRSVYDRTVGEAIPSEMLDLLGRLD